MDALVARMQPLAGIGRELQTSRGLAAASLLAAAASLLVRAVRRWLRRRGKLIPPSVPSWAPLGIDVAIKLTNLPELLPNLIRWRKSLGPVYEVTMLGMTRVWTFDPRDVKHILATNWENYEKGPVMQKAAWDLLGDGIFATNGANWRRHRNAMRPHFTRIELSSAVPAFQTRAATLLTKLEPGVPVDIQDLFFRYSLDAAAATLFGTTIRSLDAHSEFGEAFDFTQKKLPARIFLYPLSVIIPDGTWDRAIRTVDTFCGELVDEALADPKLASRTDLLAEYIKDNAEHLTREDLVIALKNAMIAARDTTSALLTWLFFNLSAHPEVEAKIRREMATVLGDPLRAPKPEELAKFKYLKQVLNETLRLYPSVPSNGRAAVRDDVLPSGYSVPAGANINYSQFVMGRMTELWGPDAEEFNPARWEDKALIARNSFAFVPFHAGPRICVGMQMAYNSAKIAAISILQKFSLRLDPSHKVVVSAPVILRSATGVRVVPQAATAADFK